nr:retrotransposon protein, putative, Ty1-copia subclass [Tanacetum cinerariifolium]
HEGSKQVGFKQLSPGVETGVHIVHDEKRVWFEVELQGAQEDREVKVFQVSNDDTAVSGVAKHLGVAGTQQQNGLVDETNVTLFASVRCFLIQSGLSKIFWVEDTTRSTYLVNRSPSSAIGLKKPVDMMGSFGWLASIKQGILEPVKVKCIFLGYHKSIVDDMLIAYKSKAEIGSTKSLLKREFDLKDLEEAKKILGMEIVRDRSRKILRVSQSGYISKILNNFRIDNGKSVQMPLDIAYAGTANVGLIYGINRGNHKDVTGFVDSDYAKDPDKGRSITGYAFLVQGCVVSRKVTLQHVVALSTIEAEYMALTEAVKEVIWLKGLLEELGVELNRVTVNCDNQGA